MTTQTLEQETYLPEPGDNAARVLSFIKAHQRLRGETPTPQYFLSGEGEDDQVQMPEAFHRVLLQVLEAMVAGKAVTVAPQNKLLTTQQAADLLGISRPTVVKLIDQGELPADKPGRRRRLVKLDDVLVLRAKRREEQYRAIMATSDALGDEESIEDVENRLRRIRAKAAERRRKSSTS